MTLCFMTHTVQWFNKQLSDLFHVQDKKVSNMDDVLNSEAIGPITEPLWELWILLSFCGVANHKSRAQVTDHHIVGTLLE